MAPDVISGSVPQLRQTRQDELTLQIPVAMEVMNNPFGETADLRLLLRLRSLAIIGQTMTLAVTGLLVDVDLPYIALCAGVGLLAALNLMTWIRLSHPQLLGMRRAPFLDNRSFFYQILVDIAVLTFLLFLGGGPVNPFLDMYLLPLTIAAAALPRNYVWRVLFISIACFSFVSVYYIPLNVDLTNNGSLLITAEWVNHVLLAGLVSYFGVRIASGLRLRDRLIEQAHIKELRNGCAVAVGSVAAGVAHELGGPLSTISIILGEMREDYKNDQEIGPSIDLMINRLEECKRTLGGLRTFVHSLNHGDEAVSADVLVDNVIDRFRNIRPGVSLDVRMEGHRPAPQINPDIALQQAVMNLLNNAGDVSPGGVSIEAQWNEKSITIKVFDNGPGISPELASKLGEMLITTKPPEKGTGLGLFLTNVTMQRLGGTLRLFNQDSGGACAELVLPFTSPIVILDTQ